MIKASRTMSFAWLYLHKKDRKYANSIKSFLKKEEQVRKKDPLRLPALVKGRIEYLLANKHYYETPQQNIDSVMPFRPRLPSQTIMMKRYPDAT